MGVFTHWPNRITALRFLGALALFATLAAGEDAAPAARRNIACLAFWLFVVTAATDVLDGWLARHGNQVTVFGRIADPFVDKILILGAMILLAVAPWSAPMLPAWIVVVILAREFLVTGIRSWVESTGGPFPADAFGKIKMILQCLAVGGILWTEAYRWNESWRAGWRQLASALVYATLVATILSGVSYILKTRRLLAGVDR